MNTKRTLATLCLALSCGALFLATNVSVGQQPEGEGVVRLTAAPQPPVPPVEGAGTTTPGNAAPGAAGNAGAGVAQLGQGQIPNVPMTVQPLFQPGGVTESPVLGRMVAQNPEFGPVMMFESNIDQGLGFAEGWHRLNARIPYHIVPNTTVLMADLSASLTNQQNAVYNFGVIYRNYDASTNRIFGWNAYADIDDGLGSNQWKRLGVGVESIGRFLDMRANYYHVMGNDSVLLNSTLTGNLALAGNNVFRLRTEGRENAYSGGDIEFGGPLPVLGRRGVNMYVGTYYLNADEGHDTVGLSARWEMLLTESVTLNAYFTNDGTFGTNSWAGISYEIPNYRERSILEPRRVRDRLPDPVRRHNRVHHQLDVVQRNEAVINPKTGLPYFIVYVNPDFTSATNGGDGAGTLLDPFTSMEVASANNIAAGMGSVTVPDIIRVDPRIDQTDTNLTVAGGLDLLDCQTLLSSTSSFTLFTIDTQNFDIEATRTGAGALISNPTIGPAGSVVRIANDNNIVGMQIDGSNAANTAFGTGVTNIGNTDPFTNLNLLNNTFLNYETAVNLSNGSGTIIADGNTLTGTADTSNSGLILTTTGASMTELLVRNNTLTNHAVTGINITATAGSTINANDPSGNVGNQATGLIGNNVMATGAIGTPGDGIIMEAQAGATVNLVAENNVSSNNIGNGFVLRANGAGATINLQSLRANDFSNNTQNGALLNFINGGVIVSQTEDTNEDVNFNGVLDTGEDLDLDSMLTVFDGTLGLTEDLNGNGILDQGIVSNIFNDNAQNGLLILGQTTGSSIFDIGGAQPALGNTFTNNLTAGLGVDLQDTAEAQLTVINNTMSADTGVPAVPALTFVIDFLEPAQGAVPDPLNGGAALTPFDITAFGLTAADFDSLTTNVLNVVSEQYKGIPTSSADPLSPIPDGMELAIDFVIGDLGSAPSNGATEHYTTVVAEGAPDATTLGRGFIGTVRDATGAGSAMIGDHVSTNYSDNIAGTLPISGDLTQATNIIANTISHEVGHNLSLNHVVPATSVTPSGGFPIMSATAPPGASQLEFSYSGIGDPSGAAVTHVQQLIDAVGLRPALSPGVSGDGINITAGDTSRLLPSTFINNTIEGNGGDGLQVIANDSARVEGLTIQGNTLQGNNSRGIDLHANGATAFIEASNTIGGTSSNTLAGVTNTQGNNILNNLLDGIRAVAENNGTIQGNILNNTINGNTGNGVSLIVDEGGTLDFGTLASNRLISGNTITGNGDAGIQITSTVIPTNNALVNALVRNNTITTNGGGGIVSSQFGNTIGGVTNNVVNLTIGGTTAQTNIIENNTNVGVQFEVEGNSLGNLVMTQQEITGTIDGADPLTFGDGIALFRSDASLMNVTLTDVTSSGNAGNGLLVDYQGNERIDPDQPMSGTISSIAWNRVLLENNSQDGARFITRGDSQLIASGAGNVIRNNTLSGIDILTLENSSFGDPTIGGFPGTRTVFDGFVVTGNGLDGLQASARNSSQLLLDITSAANASTAGAGNTLITTGNSAYSTNGVHGINIETFETSFIDTLVRAETPVTLTSGLTFIQGNGTGGAGGNGIQVTAAGTGTNGNVTVTNTLISGQLAGASEGTDTNGNDDIDTARGDGIAFDSTNSSEFNLIVGTTGNGNTIQGNADDGVAITSTGAIGSVPQPTVTLTDNIIGGTNGGIPTGNQGDGVSVQVNGGIAGSIPLTVSSGPIVSLTMIGNEVTLNNRRGVNILMNGASGVRHRENGAVFTFNPNSFILTNNTIESNGTQGIVVRADSDQNQNRFTLLPNFPEPPHTGFQRLQQAPFYDPQNLLFAPEFQANNFGTLAGKSAFAFTAPNGGSAFLNLHTVQNSFLTITGNTIQNNGTNTAEGEGIMLLVGTGSYLAADVRNNLLGGNLNEDLFTDSFLSAGNTNASIDVTGDNTFDTVFHDDSAQLDLRFDLNSGNQISVTSTGATYTDADALKQIVLGGGVTARRAAFFQVDNGPNLNANNMFIDLGTTQIIDAAFTAGGYGLRGAADAMFPNPEFAPFLP